MCKKFYISRHFGVGLCLSCATYSLNQGTQYSMLDGIYFQSCYVPYSPKFPWLNIFMISADFHDSSFFVVLKCQAVYILKGGML